MVYPVTGPFTRVISLKGPPLPPTYSFGPVHFWKQIKWYKQKPPYSVVLEFDSNTRIVRSYSGDPYDYRSVDNAPYPSDYYKALAYNDCYRKFVALTGDASQWAVNLIEIGQSYSMIEKRALQMFRAARDLHRFNFVGASRHLGMSAVPKAVKRGAKSFPGNWLEYHFGWEPLVQDIGNAITTLTSGVRPRRLKARGKAGGESFSRSYVIPDDPEFRSWVVNSRHQIIATVAVENQNLNVATQLGFTNPLSVAWELVPFSFVVDWFTNVGEVLGGFSDFLGLSITNVSSTAYQTYDLDERRPYRKTGDIPPKPNPLHATYRTVNVERRLGLSAPTLQIKPFNGFSPVRGLTAISLLLQQLHK